MELARVTRHFFRFTLPHESNNHRARLLHSPIVILFSCLIILFQLFIGFAPDAGLKVLGYAANIPVSEVVRLTNEKRAQSGLAPLTDSPILAQAAREKGADMLAKNYWAHVAPDGTEPWSFFNSAGYKYRYAGENLARDFSNASAAVDAWMASPSHKENLLSPKYNDIGIAVVEGNIDGVETTIIVQLFGTSYVDAPAAVPVAAASELTPIAPAQSESVASPNPAPAPTATPVAVAAASPVSPAPVIEESVSTVLVAGSGQSRLISPFSATKSLTMAVIGIFLFVTLLDGVLIAYRRTPRISGKVFAHVSFMGMILVIILISQSGRIY